LDLDEEKKIWEEIIKIGTNTALCYVIIHGPKELKMKAWKQLIRRGVANYDLHFIIKYGSGAFKKRACEQLFKQWTKKTDLHYIIKYCSIVEYIVRACEELLKKPTKKDLRCIIKFGPEKYRKKACEDLLRKGPRGLISVG
jgi:hypothetical protein